MQIATAMLALLAGPFAPALHLLSHRLSFPAWVVAMAVLFCVLLMIIIWTVKRRRKPKFLYDESHGAWAMLPSITGSTHATMVAGNDIEVLQNEALFEALFETLRGAKQAICMETFLWHPGELSEQIVQILCDKAREGLAVRVQVDWSGGRMNKREQQKLVEAGCVVAHFHPLRVSNLGRMNNRDHRKLAIVDGKIGFIGGHCVADTWLGNAQDDKHYRDVSLRVRGPIVGEMQSAFLENWIEETGEVLLGDRFFPELESCGKSSAHLVYVSASGSTSAVEVLHFVAISVASELISIQNPYFVPDQQMIKALVAAVQRGVKVQIMLPADSVTDSALVQHASHHRFGKLLEGGVRIYEYNRTLLHQKVMTIDHRWSSVGSCNFDHRSFKLNDEVTMGIDDPEVARKLEEIFQHDLELCSEYTLEQWKKRGPLHKLKDMSTFLINEEL